MAATAETLSDAPEPLNGTSLDPYGQLLKMLLPRAHSIVVYDCLGVTIWASEDNDDIELQALQQHAQAAELAEPGVMGAGFAEPLPGVEPRSAAFHAGAWTPAPGAAVPRARARVAVEHRYPAAQSRRS
jgi:hypothetical protein